MLVPRITQIELDHETIIRAVLAPHIAILETLAPPATAHALLIRHGTAQRRIPAILIERITQVVQNNAALFRSARPDIAILETLIFPIIRQLLLVFDRIPQDAMLIITPSPFLAYCTSRIVRTG